MPHVQSKAEYVDAWRAHARELWKLYVEVAEAEGRFNPYEYAMAKKAELYDQIETAANHVYQGGSK